jgi:hypothetical protein
MGVALFFMIIFFFAVENDSDKRECEKIHKPFAWSLPLNRLPAAQEADKIKMQL